MSGPFGSSQWMYNPSSSVYSHTIDQSLRFEDGDTAHLSRTPSSAGNRRTWTWSAWIKRGNISNDNHTLWRAYGASGATGDYIIINANNTIYLGSYNFSASTKHVWRLITSAVFRDVSSWYHIVASVDTTQSNSSDRAKLYINGQQVTEFGTETYPSLNYETFTNTASQHHIGIRPDVTDNFDGYMAEVNLIDGLQLGPDSFGETKDGIWVPKDVSGLTFGQNGFHLDFADSSAIGNDVSGQNNDFAVSGLVAADVTEDTPTNNHATWNPLVSKLNIALSEGNTVVNLDDNASGEADMVSTMVCPLGVDIYGEFKATAFHGGASGSGINIGIIEQGFNRTEQTNTIRQISGGVFYAGNGYLYTDSVQSGSAQATYTTNDIIGIKVDRTADEVKFYKNNVLQWTEDIDATKQYHFGVDSGYTNSTRAISYQAYFAASSWTYTPEANFLALCSASLPEPAIIDGSEYFNTVLYDGNETARSISGVNFQPDFTWLKRRTATDNAHNLYDSVRGATHHLSSSSNSGESTNTTRLTAFESDGFALGDGAHLNGNGDTYVAWNWKAGTAVSGATTGSGTAKTYTGSVNTKSGFSIIKYVGNGTSGHTIPHNLTVDGVATTPTMIMVKRLDNDGGWRVQHKDVAATHYLALDTNADPANLDTIFNDTAFNSTVFTVGNAASINSNDKDYIAYCFTDIEGYCKAGVYSGNTNADGPHAYLGFRPAWVMVKPVSADGNWWISDSVRGTYNPNGPDLRADLTSSEGTNNIFDFLSNGFKLRFSGGQVNTTGRDLIYLAFAEQPFKYANAR